MTVANQIRNLQVRFGRPDTQVSSGPGGLVLDLSVPWLAGPSEEVHAPIADATEESQPGLHLLRGPAEVLGVVIEKVTSPEDLEPATRSLYRRMLHACGSMSLCRVWNYVPHINENNGALENYHRFNMGRWTAFSEKFGENLTGRLPAASAVGIEDWVLVSVFRASAAIPRFIENPEQVPAWKYPPCYGPKSPSFCRGAVLGSSQGTKAFISGTASIKGHETIGAGDLPKQCVVTCENLRLVFRGLNLPDPFGNSSIPATSKVYLRNPADLAKTQKLLAEICGPAFLNTATFLHSDICRPDLDVEIEITSCS